ncbi:MAG: bacillithiol biosynthesis BshC [Holophaga sp.]|nr:bacillithiol biosynthesis BshC [Holophaga sp.]
METQRPVVVTGQQIGVGWTPALSVIKALAALALAQRLGGEAIYWMADEDHDRLEVASTVAFQGDRLHRHRFTFASPQGTATGWLPWTDVHQQEAEALWGPLPTPDRPTLRNHVLALGKPLWSRGLRFFSPTERTLRDSIQPELERWRTLGLEAALVRQAETLEAEGFDFKLDPREQAAWFSLDPITGRRLRLDTGAPCPAGCWLSPGAALRPLMQSLMLPVTHAVLGPAERAYWRLAEPLWEKVELTPPQIVPRPTAYVVPGGLSLVPSQLEALRAGYWEAFLPETLPLPSQALLGQPQAEWGTGIGNRFRQELARARHHLLKLDRRLHRDRVGNLLGEDPERLRQRLFPFGKPQERVLPGAFWLRDEALLDRLLIALGSDEKLVMVEASPNR